MTVCSVRLRINSPLQLNKLTTLIVFTEITHRIAMFMEIYKLSNIMFLVLFLSLIILHHRSDSKHLSDTYILVPCSVSSFLSANLFAVETSTPSATSCSLLARKQPWAYVTSYSLDTEQCTLWEFDALNVLDGGGSDECWMPDRTLGELRSCNSWMKSLTP